MNKLKATIVNKFIHDELIFLEMSIKDDILTSIVIDCADSYYLNLNQEVYVCFKETEVSIAKDLNGKVSIRNRLKSTIREVLEGNILTKITMNYNSNDIISIITTKSFNELNLKVNDNVEALIKTNDITVMRI